MPKLTIERLFDTPSLNGELPSQLRFSPDGTRLTWLAPAEDDHQRLDLWLYNIADGAARCLLNAGALASGGLLSDAEKADKERRRQFTSGITSYHWSPDNERVALLVDGAIHLLHVTTGQVQRITDAGTRQTDLKFSPDGGKLAFVRNYNLWWYDLSSARAEPFSLDGTALRHYGLPEYIAQEEMHRFDGYWWSADSSHLIFTRVDNSTVAVSRRSEIDAESFTVVEQRYPYAGAANAQVELRVAALDAGADAARPVPWAQHAGDYLARVNVSGTNLYVQSQSRNQQRLSLHRYDLENLDAPGEAVLEEHERTWVDLHDNFHPLDTAEAFLWTSTRDGYPHLYLYRRGNAEQGSRFDCRQLTHGRGRVNQVLHQEADAAYVSGWFEDPTEQHLYRVPLSGDGAPQRLSSGAAWFDATFADAGGLYVERQSRVDLPAALQLRHTKDDRRLPIAELALDANHPYGAYLDGARHPRVRRPRSGRWHTAALPGHAPLTGRIRRTPAGRGLRLRRPRRAAGHPRLASAAPAAVCCTRFRRAGTRQSRQRQSQ